MLINPSAGILGAAVGKSSDHAGEAAVILYVDQSMNVTVPQTVDGVRTEVIPTTAQAVAAGTAPQYPRANPAHFRRWRPPCSTRPSRPSSRWRRT